MVEAVESPEDTNIGIASAASSLAFPVVGIGASAGGVNALLRFFENTPANTGMAFVVILHLSPKHESNIDAILQRVTRMPVKQVSEPTRIEANHVYVISPTRELLMGDGELRVADIERPRGRHGAIDVFFRTLANVQKALAISVVLSGTGSDGALGITRIKEHGGMTLVQSPDDAEYDDMPTSAIATGMVDLVLPVAEMPQKLIELWDNARKIALPGALGLDLPEQRPPNAEAAVQGEQALRQRLIDEHTPPSVLIDQSAHILHLSELAARYLRHAGGTPSHNLLNAIRPEVRLELRTALFHAWSTDQSVQARQVRLERDGRTVLLNMTARPVHDKQSNARMMLVLFDEVDASLSSDAGRADDARDPMLSVGLSESSNEELKASNEELVTVNNELKIKAEEKLRVGELHMRLVAQSTEDYAIITLDLEGRATSWNKGAERLFGYSEAEMLGQTADAIFTPQDRANGVPAEEMRRAREDGRAEDERWHLRRDGSIFFCSGIMTPLDDGNLRGYAKIARDLTESKLAQSQREALLHSEKKLRAELQGASVLKDEFLAVMSHELKHPLNLIHVNAELLTRLPEVRDKPAVARAADVIRRTVLSQAKIIDDLLDLSRMRTGKLSLNFAPIEWGPIIERLVDAVQVDAHARKLQLRTEIDPEASLVFADPVRVEQIVWNLISNALKFTPEGGTITIRLAPEGSLARLDVIDNGRGLEPHFLRHVFDMFRQADRRSAREEGGLGIGLALVRHLTELHGGRVAVTSPGLGKGACFSVWLPLYGGGASLAPVPPAALPALEGLRILLVDDTPDTLEAFGELLKLEGADVTVAASGRQALQAAQSADFDLILSDVAMPGMDGYELMRELRKLDRTAQVPAIAVTGFGRPHEEERARGAGFSAHVAKPVGLDALIDLVHRLRVTRGC